MNTAAKIYEAITNFADSESNKKNQKNPFEMEVDMDTSNLIHVVLGNANNPGTPMGHNCGNVSI